MEHGEAPHILEEHFWTIVRAEPSLEHGRVGSFYNSDTSLPRPRGSFAGTPVIDGSGQSGYKLALRGFPPNAPLVARSGDYIQRGDGGLSQVARTYMVGLDVNADGAGKVLLGIWPVGDGEKFMRMSQTSHEPLRYCEETKHCRMPSKSSSCVVSDCELYSLFMARRGAAETLAPLVVRLSSSEGAVAAFALSLGYRIAYVSAKLT